MIALCYFALLAQQKMDTAKSYFIDKTRETNYPQMVYSLLGCFTGLHLFSLLLQPHIVDNTSDYIVNDNPIIYTTSKK